MTNKKLPVSDDLYDWVFHYNPYVKIWSAIPRDQYINYWDDADLESVLRSKNHSTLVELITKTGGDKNKLKKLVGK